MIDYTPAINQYYEAIQYQDASAAEISTWNGLLNGSTTVAEMQTAIINDPYTLNVVDPVIREYQAALGRIPDEAGITYWVGQVATNPAELGTLSVTFANSTEFSNDYRATASTPANTALVTDLYLNVLGRAPDAAGLSFWVNSGLHAAQLLQAFAQSAEFIADATAPIAAFQTEISNNPTAPYPTGSLFSLPAPASAYNVSANWKMAGMQSVGGIPNRTTVCATVNPDGAADDSTLINNAIASCPAGEVLMLAAGTFNLAEGKWITLSKGMTLRGAGPGSTIINVPNGAVMSSDICALAGTTGCSAAPAIIVGPPRWTEKWSTPTTLTADAAQGATSVTVASASGFAVGQWVLIDEASGAGWQTDPMGYGQIWAAPDWLSSSSTPATGRVAWQKHNPPQSFDDFTSNTYPYTSGTTGCYYSFCDRPTAELHLITAISGNTITFDSPLTIAYRESGSHNAQLYYPSPGFVTNAGVENMTIERSDQNGVSFQWCAYCWAKNVEAEYAFQGGIVAWYSARIEINEVYVHKCAWPVPGGAGYNIDITNAVTEAYVVNSISVLCDKAITIRSAGAGSVVAYNYLDDQFIGGDGSWQEIGINGSHAAGSHEVLFEGNYGSNLDSDDTHGNAIYHTFFRNYTTGTRASFTDYTTGLGSSSGTVINDVAQQSTNGPLRAAGVMGYTYWMAFVGNVLGIPGDTTIPNGWVYQSNFHSGPGIWLLGWNGQPPYKSDPNSTSWTYRDGNFDYLNNTVTWNSSDTAHTLPNSLYLSAAPAFFSAGSGYTWPPVNPLGSPQFYTLPAKARYTAGTPFIQP